MDRLIRRSATWLWAGLWVANAAGTTGAPRPHVTAAGVVYVVRPAGPTDAMLPEGKLSLSFTCYNRSGGKLDGPAIFASSRVLALDAGGGEYLPRVQPLGIWDGPSYIAPHGSCTSVVEAGSLFPQWRPGEYVIRWEVDGGVAETRVRVLAAADYYPYRLLHDAFYNEWGLDLYGEDGVLREGLGRDAVVCGKSLVPALVRLMEEKREAPLTGREDVSPGAAYGWRVCDFAGIVLSEIWGMPAGGLRSRQPGERDERLRELGFYFQLHQKEYASPGGGGY